jgi:acetyl-CoA carboxylase carboxyltransferase component
LWTIQNSNKDGYGQTIITGYARIDGWAVGIVANQRKVVKPKGEMQFGGVIYSDSADKANSLLPIAIRKNPFSFCSGCYRFYGGI